MNVDLSDSLAISLSASKYTADFWGSEVKSGIHHSEFSWLTDWQTECIYEFKSLIKISKNNENEYFKNKITN
jgi:hypothetical protein